MSAAGDSAIDEDGLTLVDEMLLVEERGWLLDERLPELIMLAAP